MENPHLSRRGGRCIDTVAMRYIEFLEAQRLRDERNHKILNSLEKIDMRLSLMTVKTNRLLALRKQYEATLAAETSTAGDSGVTSQKQTLDHELAREKPEEEPLWKNSPSRHFSSALRPSTVPSTMAKDVRNILDGELERYISKIRSLHDETNNVQSGVEELEQNTSGDLLNVTLSDDGVDFPAEDNIKDRIKPAQVATLTANVASKIDAHKNDAQLPPVADPVDNFIPDEDKSAVEFNKLPPENLPMVEAKLSDAVDGKKSAETEESALENNKDDARVDFDTAEQNIIKNNKMPEESIAANEENIYDNQYEANDPNQQYYDYNEHYENDPNAQYDQQQYLQDVQYENQEYPAEYQEYTDEYPADENYDPTYISTTMHDPDKVYEENNEAAEAIDQHDATSPEVDNKQKQSIKKSKDIIKSILDSDTESSMEKNVSNTESDFDFN